MLPLRLQLLGIVAVLSLVLWITLLIRHNQLNLRDSLSWLLSSLVALAFVAFPQMWLGVAHAIGVQVASNALFGLGFLYVLWNLLSITVASSRNAAAVRRLSQECSLLRARIEVLDRAQVGAGRDEGPPRA